VKERISNILVIAVLIAFFFLHFGLNLVISGLSTATYVVGTRTEAVVTKTNVTRPVGEDADEVGSTAVYDDADGHVHALFVQGNAALNQHVAVAYLPFYPEFGIVLKDYEKSLPVTVVGCALSLGVFYLVWRFLVKPILRKDKNDAINGPIVDASAYSTTPPSSLP
jgi:hypothetical protein